jgi:hypothetical protein
MLPVLDAENQCGKEDEQEDKRCFFHGVGQGRKG